MTRRLRAHDWLLGENRQRSMERQVKIEYAEHKLPGIVNLMDCGRAALREALTAAARGRGVRRNERAA
jgi:hypothetical protein